MSTKTVTQALRALREATPDDRMTRDVIEVVRELVSLNELSDARREVSHFRSELIRAESAYIEAEDAIEAYLNRVRARIDSAYEAVKVADAMTE